MKTLHNYGIKGLAFAVVGASPAPKMERVGVELGARESALNQSWEDYMRA
jgi:hypothetical protein